MRHRGLYIGEATQKGRGVFCDSDLEPDTIIEVAPVIVMSDEDRKLLDKTLLHDYIFEWTPEGAKMCCMALGFVPIYNHSYQSNCEYFMNYEDQTISIKTMQHIKAGEELTINYNGDWNDEGKVWFDVV
ncbi:MAG TPA: SET domain-containing protein [Flavipsychrobacter sp.]|nr:SET domain-containing protein [Flavipsychrobacter sp.]